MNRTKILLILVIVLAAVLRFFYLGKIPNGFYSDEAAYGYNAYSILQTGKDEYGNFLPLAFRSFGDYKAPLYIYFLVPFVGIFGLNEWAVRASSAMLGVGSTVLLYFLVKKLFKNETLALLCGLFTAISPFALQFNRMAHENNLVVFLVLAGLIFFIKSLEAINYIFPSFLAFTLSIYAYHDTRVFVPLFILCLFVIYRRYFTNHKKKILLGLLISFFLLLPFINLLRTDAFWSRPKHTIFTSDLGIKLRTNEDRSEDIQSSFFLPALFHNKIISYGLAFITNYSKHFSFDFLLTNGDPVKIYQTVDTGLTYLISFPFVIYGLYILGKRNISHKWLILCWLLLAPVPSALTRFVPSASRILSIQPVFALLISLGIIFSPISFVGRRFKKFFVLIITILFTFNIAYYLHSYYFNTNIRYAKEWHYGMREVMVKTAKLQDSYSKVWFSPNAWGYIYPLFYFQYPPEKYQQQNHLSDLNDFGFGWVSSFDKYVFADIPLKDFKLAEDTLYIGSKDDFQRIKKPLYTVYYPDGKIAFYFADQNSY